MKEKLAKLKSQISERKEEMRYATLFEEKSEILYSIEKQKIIIILSSDCIGGRLMKDYRLPSFTPTVNLGFRAGDYLKLCRNPEHYFTQEITEIKNDSIHPLAQCDDIFIHFDHETEFESAKKKWKHGCKKYLKAIKEPHEVCLVMTDRNGFEPDMIQQFEELPYHYKVLFTHDKHEEAPHTFYMEGEDNMPYVDIMTKFESVFSLNRRYDRFDFYQWFYEIYSGGGRC